MRTILLLILTLLPIYSFSQDTILLTLSECQTLAIENSDELKISSTDIEVAYYSQKSISKEFLPSLSVTASSGYTQGSPSTIKGSIRDINYNATLSLQQSIYTGGATKSSNTAAKLKTSIAELSNKRTRQEVLYTAAFDYYTLMAKNEQLRAQRSYVDIVTHLYDVIETRVKEGYTSTTDLLMVETRLSEAKLQLIAANQLRLNALRNLNSTLGNLTLKEYIPTDTLCSPDELPNFCSLNDALSKRPDYLKAQKNIELQNNNIKITKSTFNPQLWLSIDCYYGTPIPNTPSSMQSTIYGIAQLNFATTIFEFGKRKTSVEASKLNAINAEYSTESLKQDIATERDNAIIDLSEILTQTVLSKQALAVSLHNLTLNTYSYEEGQLPILDVLSSQLSWINAYTAHITSLYSYVVAELNYNLAVGNF